MNDFLAFLISLGVVTVIVIVFGRKIRLSSRYERKPQILNNWNSLDSGIDPTQNEDER